MQDQFTSITLGCIHFEQSLTYAKPVFSVLDENVPYSSVSFKESEKRDGPVKYTSTNYDSYVHHVDLTFQRLFREYRMKGSQGKLDSLHVMALLP